VDPQDILNLYDREMRMDAPPGRAMIYRRPGLTFFTVPPPSPRRGWVIFTQLDPAVADETIRSTIDFYKQQGGEFEWKVYGHDSPPDIKDRLLAQGFVSEDLESVLALDLEAVPSAFWESSSVSVERLTDIRQLADVARVEDEVFAEDSFDIQAVLGVEMQETPEAISVYAAYVAGVPASSAWIRFYPRRQFAELYGGATVPGHRGKGLYRALVQARAQEARQRGVRFLVVDTSPMSRPILERNGFVFLTSAQGFVMEFGPAQASEAGGKE
jgi:GNAT superfamily N-acetyltransferase